MLIIYTTRSLGPALVEMGAQGVARRHEGVAVQGEIALSGGQGPVTGDLPQHVHRAPGIGHPGETGVAEIVPAEVFVAELRHDLVPVGSVPQDRGGDAALWEQ
nr:hypothetical protein [Nonomuraea rhodomycinica]